jgi:hypothetical protein
MAHSEICPVCKGCGELPNLLKVPNPLTEPKVGIRIRCHGCNGKGWVEVGDVLPPSAGLLMSPAETHASSWVAPGGFLLTWLEMCEEERAKE